MAGELYERKTTAPREMFILTRWEEFRGEGRANLLRLVALAAFYTVELINFHGLNLSILEMPAVVDRTFHLAMTFLTFGWFMLCLGVLYCRLQDIFPYWLKFLSTGGDLVFLTSVLTLADGPRSPLVIGYFLLIVLASLRFSLRLVWFATAGSVLCYLFLLGFARWGSIPGWEQGDITVPRYHQVIFLLGLVLTGVMVGQVIRRARHLTEVFARLPEDQGGGKT